MYVFIQPFALQTLTPVHSLGPVNQYHENSMYYSAIKPEPNPEIDNNLPHITIQLPVYKESLELVMYVSLPPHYFNKPLLNLTLISIAPHRYSQ
jgi:hypothetical protein